MDNPKEAQAKIMSCLTYLNEIEGFFLKNNTLYRNPIFFRNAKWELERLNAVLVNNNLVEPIKEKKNELINSTNHNKF